MSLFPKSVIRGAELLDGAVPGWEDRIDLERLDMEDSCNCVVGQIYGRGRRPAYDDGISALEMRLPISERPLREDRYGFDVGALGVRTYDRLNEFWSRLIRRRQR